MNGKTALTLITGGLGSGKTTLLARVLAGATRRLAVVMNEFGELAVDSEVIKGRNISYVELTGGCVCCSLSGELHAAVQELHDTVRPDWIVLEATGVAEADALVYTIEEAVPVVRLDCVVCIVDADAAVRFPLMGYAAKSQLESADLVLVNKVDLVRPEDLEGVIRKVRDAAGQALQVQTVACDVDLELLFGEDAPRNPGRTVRHDHPGHHHEVQSFTVQADRPIDRERFLSFLSTLPAEVFRAKGFIHFSEEGEWLFNFVGGRTDFEEFSGHSTRIAFIGPGLECRRDAVIAGLKACET